MKKSTIIHVVVMVVAVIAASLLASKLTADQKALLPEKATMSKMPVGGFHKFMADVEWMLFINYMGSQSTVDETNIDEDTRRLERLIALDPNLDKLYQDGVSSISVADPEKTVELLKRACENHHLRNNAEIPFYTGFVMVQYLKPANYKDAIDYFKMAMQRSGGGQDQKTHYTSYYFRSLAKLMAMEKEMDERLALAEVLFKEWQNSRGYNDYAGSGEMATQNLKERLFRALKDIKTPSEDYTPTKQVLDRASEISNKVFADSHLCMNCISPYGPGESYCASCGQAVKAWGKCKKCQRTISGAAYCPYCGTSQKK